MSRQTINYVYCDFNGIVAAHAAEFEIATDNAMMGVPGDPNRYDACGKHLAQMMADLLRKDENKKVTVTKLVKNDLPVRVRTPRQPRVNADGQKVFAGRHPKQAAAASNDGSDNEYICDQPDCDREFGSAQAIAMHRYRAHGIRSKVTT